VRLVLSLANRVQQVYIMLHWVPRFVKAAQLGGSLSRVLLSVRHAHRELTASMSPALLVLLALQDVTAKRVSRLAIHAPWARILLRARVIVPSAQWAVTVILSVRLPASTVCLAPTLPNRIQRRVWHVRMVCPLELAPRHAQAAVPDPIVMLPVLHVWLVQLAASHLPAVLPLVQIAALAISPVLELLNATHASPAHMLRCLAVLSA